MLKETKEREKEKEDEIPIEGIGQFRESKEETKPMSDFSYSVKCPSNYNCYDCDDYRVTWDDSWCELGYLD